MARRRRSPKPSRETGPGDAAGDRLQKVLAAAGMGSRRECEELIVSGRVEVDGECVTRLGTRVDPLTQEIRVDGVSLPRPKRLHFVLNKPPGVVCTNYDPSGRTRAIDLVRSDQRLYTIGRLDRSSEGMILITNDGELANQLTHPRFGVEKRYLARIVGSPNPVVFEKLKRGIHLAEGVARVSDIRVRKRTAKFTDLEIVLQEGRNREIRRILARIGHKVVRLKRIAIGPLRLGDLAVGESRPLTREEVKLLQATVSQSARRGRAGQRSRIDKKPRPERSPETSTGPAAPAARKAPRAAVNPSAAVALPPIPFEPDEVEVTELPWNTLPGAVIGAEEDGPTPPDADRPRAGNRGRRGS